MADGRVEIVVSLDESDVEKGIARIKEELSGLGSGDSGLTWDGVKSGSAACQLLAQNMQQVGGTMTQSVSQPIIAAGTDSVHMAADFETAMNQVQVATGESADGMQTLKDYAKEMGAETMYSATDAGNAMLELAKGGLTSADIQGGALANTMTLAAAGGLQLNDAANVIVQAMGAFGLSADETDRAVNALAGSANASSADVSDLSMGLAQCSAVANNAGWSIEDTTSVLGAFADAGIQGSDAGTSLKTMLMSVEAPSSSAAKAMADYGLEVRDADGHMKGASDLAQEFQDKLGGLSDEQQQAALSTIFGSDAMRAATVLMNDGADGLRKYEDATHSADSAQQMAAANMEGTNGAIESAKGSIENLQLALGDALAPVVQTVAGVVQSLADHLNDLGPGAATVAAVVGIAIAAIGPLLTVFGGVIAMIPAMQAGMALVGASVSGIIAPVLAVVAVIAAVAAAVMYLWNTNTAFQTAVMAIWSALQAAFSTVIAAVAPYFDQLVAALQNLWTSIDTVIQSVVTTIMPVVEGVVVPLVQMIADLLGVVLVAAFQIVINVVDILASTISIGFDLIQSVVSLVVGVVVGLLTGDWSMASSAAGSVISDMCDLAGSTLNGLLSIAGDVINGIVGFFSGTLSGITGIASGIFGGIADTVSNAMGDASNTVSSGLSAISGFFSGLHLEFPHINLPHFSISGDFSLDPPSVPSIGIDWYARGGVFDKASVIGIGEAGPEAALPLNSRVYGEIGSGIERSMGGSDDSERMLALMAAMLDELRRDREVRLDGREFARMVRRTL